MLTEQVESYLNYLENDRRVTPATLKNYRSTLEKFSLAHRELSTSTVKAFLRTYSNPASANTVRIRLQGLANFLETPVKISRAKEPVKEIQALTARELASLIQSGTEIDSQLGLIIQVLGSTGLRFHEFQALRQKDIVEIDGVSNIKVLGKGRKERMVPISGETLAAVQALQLPLPTRLHEKRLRELLHEAGIKAGLRVDVHPHLLRASCASIMLNRGIEAILVAHILGWSSVDTFFKHYYKPDMTSLGKAVA